MPRLVLAALLPVLALLLWSCGTTREQKFAAAAASDDPPANFTLAITVQSPAKRGLPRAQRAARYVLEPDGLLRVAVTRSASEEMHPAQTRRLSDDDVRRVWLALRDGPLFRADHPAIVPLPPPTDPNAPSPAKTTYTITFIAGDVRQILIVAEDRPGSEDVGVATKLVDQLAELAWIE
jgi:hypothetical protein